MTVWQYVKSRMQEHVKRVALEDGITYGELISYIETRAKRYEKTHRLVCVSGKSKTAHAIEILSVLASGNVAVPLVNIINASSGCSFLFCAIIVSASCLLSTP